jgi:hypothetical protein
VKKAYPDMSKDDLMKYLTHSISVWACVSLDEAGKPHWFYQKRLRWMGESYRVYRRDTKRINEQYKEAPNESSRAVMNLLEPVIDGNMDQLSDKDTRESGEYDDGD